MIPSARVPSNVYASAEFLDVYARLFFPARRCCAEDFEVSGKVFRLLTVDGRPVVRSQSFVDMHEPLLMPSGEHHCKKLRGLAQVSHDVVALEEYRSNAAWADCLGAPTTLWSGFASWNLYVDLLRSRKVWADDQRRRRRLQEVHGPIEFTCDDLREDVLPTCFAWKSARDLYRRRTDTFARDDRRAFFLELRSLGLLRASTLRTSEQLLAIWLGAVYEKRWTGWIFAFNPDQAFAKYSLGRQLLYPMLEESYRSGHREFDFSIGFEPYKLFFATHVRAVAFLGTPPMPQRLYLKARKLLKRYAPVYEWIRGLKP